MQKEVKKQNTSKKCTQYMSANELKQIQYMMRFEPRDMCSTLGLKRRTYQDYRSGARNIPQKVAALIRDVYCGDCEYMNSIGQRVDAAASREFPGGIPSELDN